jgi:hypothetical protein
MEKLHVPSRAIPAMTRDFIGPDPADEGLQSSWIYGENELKGVNFIVELQEFVMKLSL